jgi:hypothetical protein
MENKDNMANIYSILKFPKFTYISKFPIFSTVNHMVSVLISENQF